MSQLFKVILVVASSTFNPLVYFDINKFKINSVTFSSVINKQNVNIRFFNVLRMCYQIQKITFICHLFLGTVIKYY